MWSGCIDDWCGLNALLKVGIEKKKNAFLMVEYLYLYKDCSYIQLLII